MLGYRWVDAASVTYLAGTEEVAELLDELGAPVDISRRKAMALLREAGHGRSNDVVADALRFRREEARKVVPGTTSGRTLPDDPGPTVGTITNPLGDHPGDQAGPLGGLNGPVVGPYIEGPPGRAVRRGSERPDPGVIG